MTVQVPPNEKSGAYAIQSEIAVLTAIPSTAPHYARSQQLLNQRQTELVTSLLDNQRLNAATILAGYAGSKNPLAAQITALTAQAAGATAAANTAAAELAAVQVRAVQELMANGQVTAASIIASQTYTGGSHQ